MIKETTIHKTKKGAVIKCVHTSGVDLGDYFYEVRDVKGNFIERFGNRSLQDALNWLNDGMEVVELRKNTNLILKFLGYKTNCDWSSYYKPEERNGMELKWYPIFDANYHEDWNKLMSVILEIGNRTGYSLVMYETYSYWNNQGEHSYLRDRGGYDDITNIYNQVVDFIKWYNKQESQSWKT